MNEQERQALDDQELRTRISKMYADLNHDADLRNHWKFQRFVWVFMGIVAIVAIIANAYIKTHL